MSRVENNIKFTGGIVWNIDRPSDALYPDAIKLIGPIYSLRQDFIQRSSLKMGV